MLPAAKETESNLTYKLLVTLINEFWLQIFDFKSLTSSTNRYIPNERATWSHHSVFNRILLTFHTSLFDYFKMKKAQQLAAI